MINIKEKCRVCGNSNLNFLWFADVISKKIRYFECQQCGYVQTESPYWLEEAYSRPINSSDTGIISRNNKNLGYVLATLVLLGFPRGKVLDYAGGYGILVRLLRDNGVDAYWMDLYSENLLASGFEFRLDQEFDGNRTQLITAFEAFEHFIDPSADLRKCFTLASNLLISTELITGVNAPPSTWWYYGREHGQHIGFFRLKTLKYLAKEQGKYLISDGASYHLFTDKPIPLYKWKILSRVKFLLPYFFKRIIGSKTWEDHVFMESKEK